VTVGCYRCYSDKLVPLRAAYIFVFHYRVFAAILVFHYRVFAVHIFAPLDYLILQLTGHIGVISSNAPDGTRCRDTSAGAAICSHAIVVCGCAASKACSPMDYQYGSRSGTLST
jgi:hypothetical protein